MLKIRQEQMTVFEEHAERDFEEEMVQHALKSAPRLSRVIGEPGVRQTVTMGLERAKQHGFTNRGPMRFYLESMVAFGSDFDTDPQIPWAAEILDDQSMPDQMARADRLYVKIDDYYKKVMGPGNEWGIQAMRRITEAKADIFGRPGMDFDRRILAGLRHMYPEKCAYVGEAPLRSLVSEAMTSAQRYGITSEAGRGLLAGLMFGFGHGVTRDPQYPWVGRTLEDALVANPNDRASRLYDKTMVYVKRAVEFLDQEKAGNAVS